MQKSTLQDFTQELPSRIAVSVIMAQRPAVSQWADHYWEAVGVIPGEPAETVGESGSRVGMVRGDYRQTIYDGLTVSLFVDETESYYYNLMSPSPGCYIVASVDDTDKQEGIPVPFLVTLSFDEAHAYLEGDEAVFTVPIPPVLYKWVEAFVLSYHVPEKRVKRKRKNWKADVSGGAP